MFSFAVAVVPPLAVRGVTMAALSPDCTLLATFAPATDELAVWHVARADTAAAAANAPTPGVAFQPSQALGVADGTEAMRAGQGGATEAPLFSFRPRDVVASALERPPPTGSASDANQRAGRLAWASPSLVALHLPGGVVAVSTHPRPNPAADSTASSGGVSFVAPPNVQYVACHPTATAPNGAPLAVPVVFVSDAVARGIAAVEGPIRGLVARSSRTDAAVAAEAAAFRREMANAGFDDDAVVVNDASQCEAWEVGHEMLLAAHAQHEGQSNGVVGDDANSSALDAFRRRACERASARSAARSRIADIRSDGHRGALWLRLAGALASIRLTFDSSGLFFYDVFAFVPLGNGDRRRAADQDGLDDAAAVPALGTRACSAAASPLSLSPLAWAEGSGGIVYILDGTRGMVSSWATGDHAARAAERSAGRQGLWLIQPAVLMATFAVPLSGPGADLFCCEYSDADSSRQRLVLVIPTAGVLMVCDAMRGARSSDERQGAESAATNDSFPSATSTASQLARNPATPPPVSKSVDALAAFCGAHVLAGSFDGRASLLPSVAASSCTAKQAFSRPIPLPKALRAVGAVVSAHVVGNVVFCESAADGAVSPIPFQGSSYSETAASSSGSSRAPVLRVALSHPPVPHFVLAAGVDTASGKLRITTGGGGVSRESALRSEATFGRVGAALGLCRLNGWDAAAVRAASLRVAVASGPHAVFETMAAVTAGEAATAALASTAVTVTTTTESSTSPAQDPDGNDRNATFPAACESVSLLRRLPGAVSLACALATAVCGRVDSCPDEANARGETRALAVAGAASIDSILRRYAAEACRVAATTTPAWDPAEALARHVSFSTGARLFGPPFAPHTSHPHQPHHNRSTADFGNYNSAIPERDGGEGYSVDPEEGWADDVFTLLCLASGLRDAAEALSVPLSTGSPALTSPLPSFGGNANSSTPNTAGSLLAGSMVGTRGSLKAAAFDWSTQRRLAPKQGTGVRTSLPPQSLTRITPMNPLSSSGAPWALVASEIIRLALSADHGTAALVAFLNEGAAKSRGSTNTNGAAGATRAPSPTASTPNSPRNNNGGVGTVAFTAGFSAEATARLWRLCSASSVELAQRRQQRQRQQQRNPTESDDGDDNGDEDPIESLVFSQQHVAILVTKLLCTPLLTASRAAPCGEAMGRDAAVMEAMRRLWTGLRRSGGGDGGTAVSAALSLRQLCRSTVHASLRDAILAAAPAVIPDPADRALFSLLGALAAVQATMTAGAAARLNNNALATSSTIAAAGAQPSFIASFVSRANSAACGQAASLFEGDDGECEKGDRAQRIVVGPTEIGDDDGSAAGGSGGVDIFGAGMAAAEAGPSRPLGYLGVAAEWLRLPNASLPTRAAFESLLFARRDGGGAAATAAGAVLHGLLNGDDKAQWPPGVSVRLPGGAALAPATFVADAFGAAVDSGDAEAAGWLAKSAAAVASQRNSTNAADAVFATALRATASGDSVAVAVGATALGELRVAGFKGDDKQLEEAGDVTVAIRAAPPLFAATDAVSSNASRASGAADAPRARAAAAQLIRSVVGEGGQHEALVASGSALAAVADEWALWPPPPPAPPLITPLAPATGETEASPSQSTTAVSLWDLRCAALAFAPAPKVAERGQPNSGSHNNAAAAAAAGRFPPRGGTVAPFLAALAGGVGASAEAAVAAIAERCAPTPPPTTTPPQQLQRRVPHPLTVFETAAVCGVPVSFAVRDPAARCRLVVAACGGRSGNTEPDLARWEMCVAAGLVSASDAAVATVQWNSRHRDTTGTGSGTGNGNGHGSEGTERPDHRPWRSADATEVAKYLTAALIARAGESGGGAGDGWLPTLLLTRRLALRTVVATPQRSQKTVRRPTPADIAVLFASGGASGLLRWRPLPPLVDDADKERGAAAADSPPPVIGWWRFLAAGCPAAALARVPANLAPADFVVRCRCVALRAVLALASPSGASGASAGAATQAVRPFPSMSGAASAEVAAVAVARRAVAACVSALAAFSAAEGRRLRVDAAVVWRLVGGAGSARNGSLRTSGDTAAVPEAVRRLSTVGPLLRGRAASLQTVKVDGQAEATRLAADVLTLKEVEAALSDAFVANSARGAARYEDPSVPSAAPPALLVEQFARFRRRYEIAAAAAAATASDDTTNTDPNENGSKEHDAESLDKEEGGNAAIASPVVGAHITAVFQRDRWIEALGEAAALRLRPRAVLALLPSSAPPTLVAAVAATADAEERRDDGDGGSAVEGRDSAPLAKTAAAAAARLLSLRFPQAPASSVAGSGVGEACRAALLDAATSGVGLRGAPGVSGRTATRAAFVSAVVAAAQDGKIPADRIATAVDAIRRAPTSGRAAIAALEFAALGSSSLWRALQHRCGTAFPTQLLTETGAARPATAGFPLTRSPPSAAADSSVATALDFAAAAERHAAGFVAAAAGAALRALVSDFAGVSTVLRPAVEPFLASTADSDTSDSTGAASAAARLVLSALTKKDGTRPARSAVARVSAALRTVLPQAACDLAFLSRLVAASAQNSPQSNNTTSAEISAASDVTTAVVTAADAAARLASRFRTAFVAAISPGTPFDAPSERPFVAAAFFSKSAFAEAGTADVKGRAAALLIAACVPAAKLTLGLCGWLLSTWPDGGGGAGAGAAAVSSPSTTTVADAAAAAVLAADVARTREYCARFLAIVAASTGIGANGSVATVAGGGFGGLGWGGMAAVTVSSGGAPVTPCGLRTFVNIVAARGGDVTPEPAVASPSRCSKDNGSALQPLALSAAARDALRAAAVDDAGFRAFSGRYFGVGASAAASPTAASAAAPNAATAATTSGSVPLEPRFVVRLAERGEVSRALLRRLVAARDASTADARRIDVFDSLLTSALARADDDADTAPEGAAAADATAAAAAAVAAAAAANDGSDADNNSSDSGATPSVSEGPMELLMRFVDVGRRDLFFGDDTALPPRSSLSPQDDDELPPPTTTALEAAGDLRVSSARHGGSNNGSNAATIRRHTSVAGAVAAALLRRYYVPVLLDAAERKLAPSEGGAGSDRRRTSGTFAAFEATLRAHFFPLCDDDDDAIGGSIAEGEAAALGMTLLRPDGRCEQRGWRCRAAVACAGALAAKCGGGPRAAAAVGARIFAALHAFRRAVCSPPLSPPSPVSQPSSRPPTPGDNCTRSPPPQPYSPRGAQRIQGLDARLFIEPLALAVVHAQWLLRESCYDAALARAAATELETLMALATGDSDYEVVRRIVFAIGDVSQLKYFCDKLPSVHHFAALTNSSEAFARQPLFASSLRLALLAFVQLVAGHEGGSGGGGLGDSGGGSGSDHGAAGNVYGVVGGGGAGGGGAGSNGAFEVATVCANFRHFSALGRALERDARRALQLFLEQHAVVTATRRAGAVGLLDSAKDALRRQSRVLEDIESKLLCAANFFLRDGVFDRCHECLRTLRLLATQRRFLVRDAVVLGASHDAALGLVFGGLEDPSDVVAAAHGFGLASLEDWARILFHQSVRLGRKSIARAYRQRCITVPVRLGVLLKRCLDSEAGIGVVGKGAAAVGSAQLASQLASTTALLFGEST